MDSIEEALLAIFIGIVVAEFLRKTSRVLQAIEVFKECLIKLHSQVLAIDGSLANTMFRALYIKITFAYVYSTHSVNMTRPENIRRKHSLTLTGMGKQQATET